MTKSIKIKSVEWYTPAWVFEHLGLKFDLDPASPIDFNTPVPALKKYTLCDDGLKQRWFGRVWLNPPFGKDTKKWMQKMSEHGNGIALCFSRTDAAWCQLAMRTATAILFVSGRMEFIAGAENQHKRSRAGAGTVIFAWGNECADALLNLRDKGVYVRQNTMVMK